MKLEIIRGVMINGEPVKAGSFVEVDRALEAILISSGKARVAVEQEPAVEKSAAPSLKPPSKRGRPKNSFGGES